MTNNYFQESLENCKKTLKSLNSNYPEIEITKQHILQYNLANFENSVFDNLKNKLIKEWVKYQSKSNVEEYDIF